MMRDFLTVLGLAILLPVGFSLGVCLLLILLQGGLDTAGYAPNSAGRIVYNIAGGALIGWGAAKLFVYTFNQWVWPAILPASERLAHKLRDGKQITAVGADGSFWVALLNVRPDVVWHWHPCIEGEPRAGGKHLLLYLSWCGWAVCAQTSRTTRAEAIEITRRAHTPWQGPGEA